MPQAAFVVSAFAHSQMPLPGALLRPTHRFVVPRPPSKDTGGDGGGADGGGGDDGGGDGGGGDGGGGDSGADAVSDGEVTPATLIALAMGELERPKRPQEHQPSAVFNLGGERLRSAAALLAAVRSRHGLLLLEGGQWMWPAPHVGHTWEVPVTENETVRLRVVSQRPRVLEVDEFLRDEECSYIVGKADGHMFTSG
eukprot:6067937-Prymnesium_polylepis.1